MREKCEKGGLSASDFEDSTFSFSSVGNIAGRYFVPTILSPQVAIIAIGKAKTVPKLIKEDDGISGGENFHRFEPIEEIGFSISADHRILDGATVARFALCFKNFLENPNSMLLHMN